MDSAEQDRDAPNVIAVAASAGGISATAFLLHEVSPKLAAAFLVVQHLDPNSPSMLASILARSSVMPVATATEGALIRNGRVYVAPPNRHMLVTAGQHLHLTDTAPLHYVRPSADALFESLPDADFGKVVCVVLSGSGMDGAAGVVAVKRAGGTVIAQDKSSAEHFGMPEASIRTGSVDLVLNLEAIPAKLLELVGEQ